MLLRMSSAMRATFCTTTPPQMALLSVSCKDLATGKHHREWQSPRDAGQRLRLWWFCHSAYAWQKVVITYFAKFIVIMCILLGSPWTYYMISHNTSPRFLELRFMHVFLTEFFDLPGNISNASCPNPTLD